MGLFINGKLDVYKFSGDIEAPNQMEDRKNFLQELLKEQEIFNQSVQDVMHSFSRSFDKIEHEQSANWNDISNQLIDLKQNGKSQNEFAEMMVTWMKTIDEKTEALRDLVAKEENMKQVMIEQLKVQSKATLEIAEKVDKVQIEHRELNEQQKEMKAKFDQHEVRTEELLGRLDQHEVGTKEVLVRLDQQEALVQRMLRQMNDFRSILFERTNHLVEKIESGYELTSSYIYKLMTGSDQPLTFYMKREKNLENSSIGKH
jgi:chromosome segregation ATPase